MSLIEDLKEKGKGKMSDVLFDTSHVGELNRLGITY
jgi:hypothetical protein